MIEIAFWSAAALIVYAYVGYPVALRVLCVVRDRPVRKGNITPRVTFIITAHNEGNRIRSKIENTLAQGYPPQALEVIVASDCSTDETDQIAASFGDRIRLIRAPQRRGKEAAQRLAIDATSGDVLIFSDAATWLAADGISAIVRNFADPSVGCVSSIDRFVDEQGQTSGEGLYVRYEMFLRMLESRVNGLIGLSGSFFAARRVVCRRWAADRQSDFSTVLSARELGLRAVLDTESAGYYRTLSDEKREFQRKIRTVVRGIAVLVSNARMLNPFAHGLFAWQLASHKLARWLVPFGMLIAWLTGAALMADSTFYLALFLLQCSFYAAAILGILTGTQLLKVPAFLVVANLAVLTAWGRYARGERITTWDPSERVRGLPQPSPR
jgi:glycosyltransferase involved in cell wall biosynthesis